MINYKKDFFKPSELAKCLNISRELLIYYCKKQIITPDAIAENGYRYYSFIKFFELQIIVNLRKLKISLPTIKQYLQAKNEKKLEQILIARNKKIEEEKAQLEKQQLIISNLLDELQEIRDLTLDKPFLKYNKKEYLVLSQNINQNTSDEETMKIFINHQKKINENFEIFSTNFSLIVNSKDFFSKETVTAKNIFYTIKNIDTTKYKNFTIKPEGKYLTLCLKSSKLDSTKLALQKLNDYISQNNLKIDSKLYISVLKNLWLTNKKDDYIFKYSILIDI